MYNSFFTPEYMLFQQVLKSEIPVVPVLNEQTLPKPLDMKPIPEYPTLTPGTNCNISDIRRTILFSQTGNTRIITTIRVQ